MLTMEVVFSNIAFQDGEVSEETKRIRGDLQKIEEAIKKWKPGINSNLSFLIH